MIQDWHTSFKVQLDTLDSNNFVRIEHEIIDILFNKVIDKVIQDAYEEYEESQRISDYLSNQLLFANPSFNEINSNQYLVALPSDYYFHITSTADIKYNNQIGNVSTRKELLDYKSKVLQSPYQSPDGWEIPMFFEQGGIMLYTGKGSLENFNLTYLKKPKLVSYKENISSDLHPALHNKVIQDTVLLALETYSSERYQTKGNLNNV